ncbi:amino acid ABC transporter permease [Arthrobacter glacialis]|uniref:ABC transporter permease n=1 Tax=Arthrobacter glacialis TaxID=1664 RepID=A0A2S4A1B0_ARTGL|nr:amino acid ABC transporter permease [Arthrobacter glacialis]POH61169.1 ABC transporter permease [Arthrobacter glacialis]POH75305.1 ABC transporter permease [Arthrobacter glacialis]
MAEPVVDIPVKRSHDFLSLTTKPILKRRRPGQLVAVVVVLFAIVYGVYVLFTNPGFGWPTVGKYLFDKRILGGLMVTLELTIIAMVIGFVVGLLVAVMRMSDNWLLRAVSGAYIWFFRGTPLLVQLLFWGFAAVLFPKIGLGIPWGPTFVEWNTNDLIPLFAAAILGLGLNEGAYMAEIVRAGLLSVSAGQSEASRAMGFSHMSTLRFVVIPQAMKVIIPPVGNEVISMLKTTSLVIVIGVGDLLYNTQQIYAQNLKQIPLLIVASLWYILLTTILTLGQSRLEKKYSKGNALLLGKAQR